jgi:spore germination protein YaaH
MKRFLLAVFLLVLLTGGFFLVQEKSLISPISGNATPLSIPTPVVGTGEPGLSLFVPYWGLGDGEFGDEFDHLIYFGVTPGTSGVNETDVGYKGLERFTQAAGRKDAYLTLRMLDSKQNFAILENTALQNALISDTIATARAHDFEGIVLDLEVSALPFDSLIQQISSFNKQFYQAARKEKLYYAVSLYGDTFFRIRPFDVKSIAANSDEVMIMAYDFHKSRGNPGPNFPLSGKEKYGYDYHSLVEQFGKVVPKEKLTVIFGFFGYDWAVNKEKNMMTHGVPLSLNQIRERFITDCRFNACSLKRDTLSTEPSISYTDNEGLSHLVWFEDHESVAKKQEFLKNKGITSFSYWAHSYF